MLYSPACRVAEYGATARIWSQRKGVSGETLYPPPLVLAWLHHQQGRWAHIARQGTWNVERDQARQRLRLGTFLAALLCLMLGLVTLLSLWQG